MCDEGGSSTFRCGTLLLLGLDSCAAASAPIPGPTCALACAVLVVQRHATVMCLKMGRCLALTSLNYLAQINKATQSQTSALFGVSTRATGW